MCYAVVAGNESPYGIDLVLHQCDQRGNHDGCSFHHQGRQLVAERLASSCRHQDKGIVPVNKVSDYTFLVGLERVEAEEVFQLHVKYAGIYRHNLNF